MRLNPFYLVSNFQVFNNTILHFCKGYALLQVLTNGNLHCTVKENLLEQRTSRVGSSISARPWFTGSNGSNPLSRIACGHRVSANYQNSRVSLQKTTLWPAPYVIMISHDTLAMFRSIVDRITAVCAFEHALSGDIKQSSKLTCQDICSSKAKQRVQNSAE